MSPDAITACTDALATYLKTQIPSLTVYKEWPNANDKLVYPAVTIFSGRVTTMNCQPEELSRTSPDVNGQVIVTEIIGEHDFKIQLDIWCANKVQRSTVFGQISDAINAQIVDTTGLNKPAGLSLQLSDYYNDWVRYDIDGHQNMDDEAAAQRQERRLKLDLLVNCRAIRQRTYYAITRAQGTIGVGASDDETALTQQVSIPLS